MSTERSDSKVSAISESFKLARTAQGQTTSHSLASKSMVKLLREDGLEKKHHSPFSCFDLLYNTIRLQ